MKTEFKNIFSQPTQNNLGQITDPKQQEPKPSDKSDDKKKEQQQSQASGDAISKLISEFFKNPSNIILGIAGAGLVYFIFQLLNDKNKLAEDNTRIQTDFKSFRNETRSEINGLKRELKKTRPKSKKRFEETFDVTDVEGSYVIETDEKSEDKKPSPSSEFGKSNIGFIA